MSSKYFFTQNDFQGNEKIWEPMLVNYDKDKPLKFLQIGCGEGQASTFILDNYMNHPHSFLHCVDPYDNSNLETFKRNISLSGNWGKVVLHKEKSRDILPLFLQARREYDVIYINGSQLPKDIMNDALMCSDLIARNGMLILNHYGNPENDFQTRKTINEFINMLDPNEWRIAGNWYQMFLQKSFRESRNDIWEIHY